jgi:two-component system response regulator HydG
LNALNSIIGSSPPTLSLKRLIESVAHSDATVLIIGESGTGKELVAKSLHDCSPRAEKNLVPVNCGAIPRELIESELFGHKRGSFTGAVADRVGRFELAHGGTLFLDEIGDLALDMQVKLLRAIQERVVEPVGGGKPVKVEVRVVAATHKDLEYEVEAGRFREDLYYRFNEFTINVPPLRKRGADIMEFANHFLDLANEELNKNVSGFEAEVINLFNTYEWPGNLREMNNVIRRSLLLTDKGEIKLSSIPPEIVYSSKFNFVDEDSTREIPQEERSEEIRSAPKDNIKEPISLKDIAANAEAEVIKKVLEETHYNKTKAAQQLGIDRKTLFNKLKQHNIQS